MKDNGYYNNTMDFWLQKAIRDIEMNYGHQISIAEKGKDLLKFGRNELIGTTRATVMDLPSGILNETYATSNVINTISSSSTSDTRQVTVEGHTIDANGDFTFVVQTITLTGQTQATLGTALARCTRLYADDTDNTDLVGNIYVYHAGAATAGVPDDLATVHLLVPAGENQSRKCATTISKDDYWIVHDFDADCYEKTSAFAEIRLEVRQKGGVWRPRETLAVSAGSHADHRFEPFLIIRPNSEIRLTAIADGASTDLGGMIQGTLAKII